jgi:hypothetical protein
MDFGDEHDGQATASTSECTRGEPDHKRRLHRKALLAAN